MWKNYSVSYIKHNRVSGISVMVAALISSLLLSLLCSLFYNLWIYEIERLKAEEGDWQGRLVGEIDQESLRLVQNYANVEKAVINGELSDGQEVAVDLYFKNRTGILSDMPRIAALAGLPEEAASYHYALLNLYLIRSPQDTALRWVFPFMLAVTALACLSLILVIHNAFGVSMHARVHQFGIFSSIGATPGQIRTCLLQEAFALCALPVVAGTLLGILLCMGMLTAANALMADVEGRLVMPFGYHPAILLFSLLATALTIWISAWIPARKMSRLTPLAAIRNTGELSLKKKKNAPLAALFFGMEGELAANAQRAQKKALRTANWSLALSFLAFSFMMCFFAIMVISQRETYFEKYQDAWDVMVTAQDGDMDTFARGDALRKLSGVESVAVYQKARAKRIVSPQEISGEMQAIGGFAHAPAQYVSACADGWLVNAPLVILDDTAFLEYCAQIGAEQRTDGAVILNLTRDGTDPDFRKRRRLPYLTGTMETSLLARDGQEEMTAKLPVVAYTDQAPVLREEYGTLDFYELVHVLPLSFWETVKGQLGEAQPDVCIRILADDRTELKALEEIEAAVRALFDGTEEVLVENRIQDRLDNDKMIAGMEAAVSVFCILLACIGTGNVFSNALGFVRQRKREFARYLSIGMTPAGIRKIFFAEALGMAGRPVLIALPVTAAAVIFFLRTSYLEPSLFLKEMPFVPILLFILAIFAFVALAYYLGARQVLSGSLVDSLRDDTMV